MSLKELIMKKIDIAIIGSGIGGSLTEPLNKIKVFLVLSKILKLGAVLLTQFRAHENPRSFVSRSQP